MKLRGRTAELEFETGRWDGLRREERMCWNCRSGEVEDVGHFVLKCTYVASRGKGENGEADE